MSQRYRSLYGGLGINFRYSPYPSGSTTVSGGTLVSTSKNIGTSASSLFPVEIWITIINYLDGPSIIYNFWNTCKELNNIVLDYIDLDLEFSVFDRFFSLKNYIVLPWFKKVKTARFDKLSIFYPRDVLKFENIKSLTFESSSIRKELLENICSMLDLVELNLIDYENIFPECFIFENVRKLKNLEKLSIISSDTGYIYSGLYIGVIDVKCLVKLKVLTIRSHYFDGISMLPESLEELNIIRGGVLRRDFKNFEGLFNIGNCKKLRKIKITAGIFHLFDQANEMETLLTELSKCKELTHCEFGGMNDFIDGQLDAKNIGKVISNMENLQVLILRCFDMPNNDLLLILGLKNIEIFEFTAVDLNFIKENILGKSFACRKVIMHGWRDTLLLWDKNSINTYYQNKIRF